MTVIHGGDIAGAMALAREAGFEAGKPEDWLDLSTGINPSAYPVPAIPADAWHRLPGMNAMSALLEAAAGYYDAPTVDHIIAAPGSALLIQLLPHLLANKDVFIVSPTYGDHALSWKKAGAQVTYIEKLQESRPDGITVVVNPNNPDGRAYDDEMIKEAAERHTQEKGWLIIDEAFGDVSPYGSAAALAQTHNVIILKSIGKFFGLAGLRLGFAISRPDICARLASHLGSWPVSGPALITATKALEDNIWQDETRHFLKHQSGALNQLLKDAKIKIIGSTNLFTLIEDDQAEIIFHRLLKNHIYVRRFEYNSCWLRIGIPADEQGLIRLREALGA